MNTEKKVENLFKSAKQTPVEIQKQQQQQQQQQQNIRITRELVQS